MHSAHISVGKARGSVVPPFVPHPLVRGGHAQTIVGRYLPGPQPRFPSAEFVIDVSGGDRLLVQESVPANADDRVPAAVLVHGLAGCARSPYITRVAARLLRLGVRVVRMNLRGAGAGFGLARSTYHAGRSEDLRSVVEWLAARVPEAPIAVVGFSLGGNLALKLAAEAASEPLAGFDCVVAASPSIDLAACSHQIRRPENRIYDRNFVRQLTADVRRLHGAFPDLGPIDLSGVDTLYAFDAAYTAPRHGFADAEDYFTKSSARPSIPRIAVPGIVVHADDDPFIPVAPFEETPFPAQLELEITRGGGHLGYLSRQRWDGDRRWLDVRLTDWLANRWFPDRAR